MVANSDTLTREGKRNTGKTAKLTPEQALEILQQSVINCQQAGVDAKVLTIEDGRVVIVLANVKLDAGNIVLAIPKNAGNMVD